MTSFFDVTPASTEVVTIGPDGKKRFTFTVTSRAERTVRAIVQAVPLTNQDLPPGTQEILAPLDAKWLTVDPPPPGATEPPRSAATPGMAPRILEFRPKETRQIEVGVAAPAGAAPGLFRFKLVVALEEDPGAHSSSSTPLGFRIPGTNGGTTKKWPLILAIVGGIVVLGGGIALALRGCNGSNGAETRPTMVDVPQVEGTEFVVAVAKLVNANLTPVRKVAISADKPEGTVLAQTPKAGEKVAIDSVVELEVAGRAVRVPSVKGKLLAAAGELITARDLTFKVTGAKVTNQPIGTVLTQSPEAEAAVEPGRVIELTIEGKGAAVPNVVGQVLTDAILALQRSGLQVSSIEPKADKTKPAQTVAGQDPRAATRVESGAKVKLIVWTQPGRGIQFTKEHIERLRKGGVEEKMLRTTPVRAVTK